MSPAPVRRTVSAVRRRIPRRWRIALRRAAAGARPFQTPSVRELCELPAGTPLLVHAGGVTGDRALAGVVRALARLPEFHLALVRDEAERAATQDLIRGAGKARRRIHEVPRPRTVTAAFLASADVGVFGFEPDAGLALLDTYLAAGLRVVAADSRVVREHLAPHRAGDFFAPGSLPSFTRAVERARQRGDEPPTPEDPPVAPIEAGTPGPWRALGAGPVRLGLGTANYAGQLSALAVALTAARADVGVELVMAKPPATYRYPADRYLNYPGEHRLDVQVEQARRVLGWYTHLIVDAFRPVLGRGNGDDISADLPALRRARIKVALLAHGSEIRHPGAHLERHAESAFRDADEDLRERLTTVAERNRRTAEESGLPFFVTTPDLLDDVPFATWAPLIVDVDDWACDRPVLERARPVVLHAPSKRWTKGTDRLLPRLQELDERRIIELRLVEGLPHHEMRRLVQDCDIVVDQLVMGSYGTFSCEGMAAGKVVVAYVSEGPHRAAGVEPPIANATPSTLVKTIESLLDDRTAAVALAAEGARYVRDHHDGRRTAEAFDAFLR
ncbi:Glycosyltransferase involved in cell wall bisynthesis [Micromonospora sediminicola]|uniref:Glycosyltransferase involved in cell wall bisynthesis n=1 Tax=Micromonospora sediminicola TaxID=946078 RepID=A0A1A9BEX1_9ACTN|nr:MULTISPECIES: glycosyltransferase [Micromonospora]PGH45706.1 glycosyl transferase family 1 [Micromonospora sp. WMMA1996]SBT67636.1 Glycosyltransferase involved in cell wall bisynthesis [Micromonospora sediminicola]